jgi:SAM-dependent methyltransferase
MSLDEHHTLERDRRAADRDYNDALTAFDAALVRATLRLTVPLGADSSTPPLPAGWRGWRLRSVWQWLAPWIERQHAFNARTAAAIDALADRDHEDSIRFEQFEAALITFLQRITAFVDTKERLLAATAAQRLDKQERLVAALEEKIENGLPEWRAQMAVLQRAIEMLKRRGAAPATAAADRPHTSAVATTAEDDAYKYVAFEDAFRGSPDSVRTKLDDYLPIFAGATDVIDLGCGRGEFLAALRAAGVSSRGVDDNDGMVAAAQELGLDVIRGDALAYVTALPDESIGGAIATQVIEHMEPGYLLRLLEALSRALRRGAPIVLETINPQCWFAFFSSYIRDLTHVRPVHPETLQYLLRASGFERVEIRYRTPLPEVEKLKVVELSEDIRLSQNPSCAAVTRLAEACNANAARLNGLMFSYMDYAVVGYRS